jgi:hypothetical protein
MLRKTVIIAFALAGCGTLAACSTPHQITLRDGRTVYTADTPRTDEDTGFVVYKKRDGDKVEVNKTDVLEIRPVE